MSDITAKTLVFSSDEFRKALNNASDETLGDVKAAVRSALNKVTRGVKSLTSAEIRRVYNVSKALLDSRLTLFTARVNDLEATLTVGGKSMSLSYFGMTAVVGRTRMTVGVKRDGQRVRGQLKSKTMKRIQANQGITVEVIRGRKTTLSKSAFVAVMKSGHIGIMHRGQGVIKSRMSARSLKHKQRIYENSVVSIATMFSKAEVHDSIVAKVDADLERIFWNELEFFTTRAKK